MPHLKFSEHLQETLLHLEQTRRQEQKLREESDAILSGLSALVSAVNREDVLSILQSTFHKLIKHKDCWIMQQCDNKLVSSTHNISLPIKKGFQRVLNGKVLNAFDVSQIPEWQQFKHHSIKSALHMPIHFSDFKGMLILTSEEKSAFSRESIDLAQRIIPFSEQAIAKIELIDLAHAKELEEQRKLMQLILDHMPVGTWMLSKDREMMFINRTFCDAVGIPDFEFLRAKHYAELLPESVSKQCMASDRACFEGNSEVHSRETIPCADGKERTFDVIKVPLLNEDNIVSAIIGIAVDATEQIKHSQEKEKIKEQLLHTQKLESLGVLAGGIAHDFNNILSVIMGYASLAMKQISTTPENIEPHLQRIIDSSERAADLCTQMLAYSGQGKFIVKPLNLSDLIESIINILEVSLNKGVKLELILADDIPLIEADETQIQQIAMNLITNANEAINDNSGSISIQTGVMQADKAYLKTCMGAENATPGNYVYIEVRDSGCGMTEDIMSHIFDPFFTTKFTGRGLGLSAVLGIVKSHSGALKLISKPSQGTTFRVLFPALTTNSIAETKEQHLTNKTGNKKSIALIVDDEENIRLMLSEMIIASGFDEVLMASDGLQALSIYKEKRNDIDIILLDLTMPNMDGEETFKKLLELDPDVKVIISSGYSQQKLEERFADKGCCNFLQKPYQLDKLQNAIQPYLKT